MEEGCTLIFRSTSPQPHHLSYLSGTAWLLSRSSDPPGYPGHQSGLPSFPQVKEVFSGMRWNDEIEVILRGRVPGCKLPKSRIWETPWGIQVWIPVFLICFGMREEVSEIALFTGVQKKKRKNNRLIIGFSIHIQDSLDILFFFFTWWFIFIMDKTTFGIIGLLLGMAAVLTGFYAISVHSLFMAGGYLFFVVVVGVLFIRFFCASCPIKDTCVHIIPGYIARMWKVAPGPYSSSKLMISGFLFVILFLPPLPSLLTSPVLMIIFLVCLVLG